MMPVSYTHLDVYKRQVLDSLLVLMKPAVETYNKKNREKMNKYLKDIKQ